MNWQSAYLASPMLGTQACSPHPVWVPSCVCDSECVEEEISIPAPPAKAPSANSTRVNMSSELPVYLPRPISAPSPRSTSCLLIPVFVTCFHSKNASSEGGESEARVLHHCHGPRDLARSRCSINICGRRGWGTVAEEVPEEEGSCPAHLAPVEECCPEEGWAGCWRLEEKVDDQKEGHTAGSGRPG